METFTDQLAKAGGLFAILSFAHFFVDWFFQTHKGATSKAKDGWQRAIHCTLYTLLMSFIMIPMFGKFTWGFFFSLGILWGSHFFEDTYKPVLWWARHVRKIPDGWPADNDPHAVSLSLILGITIDQLFHLGALWVPVGFIVWG